MPDQAPQRRAFPPGWAKGLAPTLLWLFCSLGPVLLPSLGGRLAAVWAAGLSVDGSLRWSARYPWGDAAALGPGVESLSGWEGQDSPNRLQLSQQVQLTLAGELLPDTTIRADLNSTHDDHLQLLAVELARGPWRLRAGDQRVDSGNPFTVYNLSLKGLSLDYRYRDWQARLVAARWQGIPATKTFVGGWSTDSLLLVGDGPAGLERRDGEWVGNLSGLIGARLDRAEYDPGFMGVYFQLVDHGSGQGETLAQFLERFGLGYLYQFDRDDGVPRDSDDSGVIRSGQGVRLGPGEAVVIVASDAVATAGGGLGQRAIGGTDGGLATQWAEYLLLRDQPENLLRRQVQTLIRRYNEKNGLGGDQARGYPFPVGSEMERQFLRELGQGHVRVRVGQTVDAPQLLLDQPLPALTPTGRFFDLGHGQVEVVSVQVQLRLGGGWRPATEVPGFLSSVWGSEGIVELTFPASFDVQRDAVRIQYRYAAAQNVYSLGPGVVRGSERVYLNGRQLTAGQEYTVDEEVGLLVLLIEIGPADTLRVDYEYTRGGLGAPAPYVRDLVGLTLSYDPSGDSRQMPIQPAHLDRLTCEVWQVWDEPAPAGPPDRLAVMPETLRLLGATASGALGPVEIRLDAAVSWDQYPPGDNRRLALPNTVASLLPLAEGHTEYLLLGDTNGLHLQVAEAGQPARWRHYSIAPGSDAERVQALAASASGIWVGTAVGLTRVARACSLGSPDGTELEEALAQPGNWESWSPSRGFPAGGVNALAVGGGQIWAGTPAGLVQVQETNGGISWRVWTGAEGLPSGHVTALAWDGVAGGWASPGTLWIGTDQGLAWLTTGTIQTVAALRGQRVAALALGPLGSSWQGIVVATSQGLWFLPAGSDPANAASWSPVLPASFVTSHPVFALAIVANAAGPGQDHLFVGTADGLWFIGDDGPGGMGLSRAQLVVATSGWTIPSLAGSSWDAAVPELWVGTQGRLPDRSQAASPGERHALGVWRGTAPQGDWVWQQLDGQSIGLRADDPSRYEDLPPAEHRSQGYAAALELNQAERWGEWRARLLNVEPGFRSLGRQTKGEELTWTVQGSLHPTEGLTAGVRVENSRFGAEGSQSPALPWGSLHRGVSVGWTPSWAGTDSSLHLSYDVTEVDDGADGTGDRARTEWKAGWEQSLAGGAVAAQLDWEGVDSWDQWLAASNYSAQQLRVGLQWRPSPAFRWSVDGTQPLSGGGGASASGVSSTPPYGWQTQAGWTLTWGAGWPGRWRGSAAAGVWQRPGDGATQRQLQWATDASWVPRRSLGLSWSPSVQLRAHAVEPFAGQPRTDAVGWATLRAAGAGGLALQLEGGGWLEQHPTESRSLRLTGARVQVSWPVAGGWQPGAALGWSRLDWQNARYGQRRVDWAQGQLELKSPSWQGWGDVRWQSRATIGWGWLSGREGLASVAPVPQQGYQAGAEMSGQFPSGLALTWRGRWVQSEAVWAATAGAGQTGTGGSGLLGLSWGPTGLPGVGLEPVWVSAGAAPVVGDSPRQAGLETGIEVGYVWASRWQLSGSLTWRQVWLRSVPRGSVHAWIPEISVRAAF